MIFWTGSESRVVTLTDKRFSVRRQASEDGSGVIIALVCVIVILAIAFAYVAKNSVSSLKSAETKLSQLGAEKTGLKELQEASDKLKSTLSAAKDSTAPPCEQIQREFQDLKKRIEEAKIKGGVGIGTAWLIDRPVNDLQGEIDKLCPP